MARTIFHSFAALTRDILLLPLEHKIHIFSPPCNILYFWHESCPVNASRLSKTRNRCKQRVYRSPKIKISVKLRSLLTCSFFLQNSRKTGKQSRIHFVFPCSVMLEIELSRGKFSLDNGKDLVTWKYLYGLITMSQLTYSMLQSS